MPVSIINNLIDGVNLYLTERLQDDVAVDDPTRAGLVRPGLLQDDPTRFHVSVLTFPNDPDSDNSWKHEIVVDNANGQQYNPPPYELGGGEMWYRRFTTSLELFYRTSVKREQARELSNVILSRAELAIAQFPVANEVDDFGELALQVRVMSSLIDQGGGDGQAIWHGKIWWQVLTGKLN